MRISKQIPSESGAPVARPAAWRVLDILIALIMVSLGAGLIVGL